MSLKHQHLLQFIAVAETLNFRKAAERLHMAQPPLSASIRKLEEALGGQLFERGRSGVRLTAAGVAMLEPARSALRAVEQCQQAAQDALHGVGGVLRVGYVGTATYSLLFDLLGAAHHEVPRVQFKLSEAISVDIVRDLLADRLDVGLVRYPVFESGPVEIEPLVVDEFMLAIRADAAPRRTRRVALSDVADRPFIMYSRAEVGSLHAMAMLLCQRAGFVPRVVQETRELITMVGLVRAGFGVALVPGIARRYVGEDVRLLRLSDTSDGLETGLALATVLGRHNALAQNLRRLALERYGRKPKATARVG